VATDAGARGLEGREMNRSAKTVMDAVLSRTPAQPVFHWRAARSLAVLAYHDIRDPDGFAAQLDHIRRTTHPVRLPDVIQAAEGRAGLPPRATLLTFDDGHRDLLEVAMPLLRERGIPAAAFVVAGLIGTSTPHWWTEVKKLVRGGGTGAAVAGMRAEDAVRALKRVPNDVRIHTIDELRQTASHPAPVVVQLRASELSQLESAGIDIGSHSLTHPCLSRCGSDTIKFEVERSSEILAGALGHDVEAFAYPDGDRDARVSAIVREAEYRIGLLFDHRMSSLKPPDPFNVSRLRVDADAAFDRFKIILSGLHPTIHSLRGLR
jgi:peptidoglycan/xylan/chitin deacetylase (PgdA/CDA1 family)